MADRIDLEAISKDVLAILQKHGLTPDSYGVSLTLHRDDFDTIANGHPDHVHPGIILRTIAESDGLQWSVQIIRRRAPEDFPPGVILTPPPDK